MAVKAKKTKKTCQFKKEDLRTKHLWYLQPGIHQISLPEVFPLPKRVELSIPDLPSTLT